MKYWLNHEEWPRAYFLFNMILRWSTDIKVIFDFCKYKPLDHESNDICLNSTPGVPEWRRPSVASVSPRSWFSRTFDCETSESSGAEDNSRCFCVGALAQSYTGTTRQTPRSEFLSKKPVLVRVMASAQAVTWTKKWHMWRALNRKIPLRVSEYWYLWTMRSSYP